MKISKPVLILSSAGLGLTLVFSEQPGKANCTPTKAQQILRQKLAELNNAGSLPSKDQLLGDIERLHGEGKISDEQFAAFKKNIQEQYVAPDSSANPEAQAKAQAILEQKIAALNAGQKVVVPPSNPEVQAKAEQALNERLKESQTSVPARPETSTVAEQALRKKTAELNASQAAVVTPAPPKAQATVVPPSNRKAQAKAQLAQKPSEPRPAASAHPAKNTAAEEVLHQKIAEVRTQEKTNVVPSSATATLTPELESKARQALEARIAADRRNELSAPEPGPVTQAKAVAVLHENEVQVKAGITQDTPEQTRILRAKIAESKGIITPEEAAKAAAAPAVTQPATQIATTAPTIRPSTPAALPIPFSTSNKVGLARLNELTELYKADKITPADYHHERAKIVASL